MKELIKNIVVRSDFLSALRRWAKAGAGELSFYRMRRSYGRTTHGARIGLYKGIHEGQRCFIIGNGPSLKPEDLDLLEHEYTFGQTASISCMAGPDGGPHFMCARIRTC